MAYPIHQLKRLRKNANIRRMLRETSFSVDNLVMPFFVKEQASSKKTIDALPGQFQHSLKTLLSEVKQAYILGIPAVLLFGIPARKDLQGSGAYTEEGIIQQATAAIKKKFPDLIVITDVCLCEFTSTGHCGIIKDNLSSKRLNQVYLDNEATLTLLAKAALSYAKAGADMVAPSAMADGQVSLIRKILDENGFNHVSIMSYSAKYASSFYGPFRQAAESAPKFGDRRTYQLDVANTRQAMQEIAYDIEEGADIVMVKPALAYLDIIWQARTKFNVPIAAYNVSGEYAMVKSAGQLGWLNSLETTKEILTSIKRAGADIIITYHALEIAKYLRGK
ncbi:MAG: porphobilinogen synthase [Candidatus Omnitrophica bacterium]|nr:porphobilinogen synthase [Candidatus Omnitrophota bacterium]